MNRKPRIVIYDDPEAATSTAALPERLRESFPDMPLQCLKTAAFLKALNDAPGTVAVIPGIMGERSRYTELLGGDEGMRDLKQFVQRGGVLVTICAGSYLVARRTEYTPPWGPARSRDNTSPLFNAVAHGPLAGLGRKSSGARFDDVTVAAISVKGERGWTKTGMAYGNGPALFPFKPDLDLEVLARFADEPDKPIAAAWKTEGRGAVLWLGVLPYIGYDPQHESTGLPNLDKLSQQLKPYEDGRRAFWDMLARKIRIHIEGNAKPQGSPSIEGPPRK